MRVIFGKNSQPSAALSGGIELCLPRLAGEPDETIFASSGSAENLDGVTLVRDGELLLGHAWAPFDAARLVEQTHQLYTRIFAACAGRKFYRIWNYVPQINEAVGGLENYRAFCKGRSLAFEKEFGTEFQQQLSAASAVGSKGETLDVIFAAGSAVPRHLENPEQVPAYHYPAEHGPRSPSFSRATSVDISGRRRVFVSGTAAIKGHASVAPGKLREQIECTLDNLRLVSQACELGENLAAGEPGWTRHFKVYLRHAGDLAEAQALLQGDLLREGDSVNWLHADICRAELNIEIEATLGRV